MGPRWRSGLAAAALGLFGTAVVAQNLVPVTDRELKAMPSEPVTALVGPVDKRVAMVFQSPAACIAFAWNAADKNRALPPHTTANMSADDELVSCYSQTTGKLLALTVRGPQRTQQMRPNPEAGF